MHLLHRVAERAPAPHEDPAPLRDLLELLARLVQTQDHLGVRIVAVPGLKGLQTGDGPLQVLLFGLQPAQLVPQLLGAARAATLFAVVYVMHGYVAFHDGLVAPQGRGKPICSN